MRRRFVDEPGFCILSVAGFQIAFSAGSATAEMMRIVEKRQRIAVQNNIIG
jgi:hypothetical protein